jgi:predicted O-methyltransferase YrrM
VPVLYYGLVLVFAGMSALAMAEGVPKDGQVVTLENSDECANVAEECFKKAKHGAKIKLLRGDAIKAMKKMLKGMINIYIGGRSQTTLAR